MVVSQSKLTKAVIKADGNYTKAAEILGIKKQSVADRINRNPTIKKAILNVREEALKKAGISRSLVYGKLKKGLDSKIHIIADGKVKLSNVPDRHEIREYSKLILQLFKDLDPDKEQSTTNIGQVIFQMLGSHKREAIEVV